MTAIILFFLSANHRAHKYGFKASFHDTSLNGRNCLTLMKTDEFTISLLSVGTEQNPFIIKTEGALVFQLVLQMSFSTYTFQPLGSVYK